MAKKPNRGRILADKIVVLLNAIPTAEREYSFLARRARLPRVKVDELDGGDPTVPESGVADVTVAPMTKAGDEQDRGSELLLYGITVGVTAHVGDMDSPKADLVDDLIEQLHNYLSEEDQQEITLGPNVEDFDYQADLELPFVADPLFNMQLVVCQH